MNLKSYKSNESGIVSLMLVSFIIVILSLITIGFSRVMNRQYRQTLDRQSSSVAYYAAESGLNDARRYIQAQLNLNLDPSLNNCGAMATTPLSTASELLGTGTGAAVKYTCVIINAKPTELNFEMPVGDSRVFYIDPTSASGLNNLLFSWENQYGGTFKTAGSKDFPSATSWGSSTGVLRVTIYPIVPAATSTRAKLQSLAKTYFLYPNSGGTFTSIPYVYIDSSVIPWPIDPNNGEIYSGSCAYDSTEGAGPSSLRTPQTNMTAPTAGLTFPGAIAENDCNAAVTGLSTTTGDAYFVRITSLYQSLDVKIRASSTLGSALTLGSSEASVDVTGRSGNVLKRIKAYVSLTPQTLGPNDAVESALSLCKDIRVPALTDLFDPNTYDVNLAGTYPVIKYPSTRPLPVPFNLDNAKSESGNVAYSGACSIQ